MLLLTVTRYEQLMPIANYTTSYSVYQSLNKITKMLIEHGARRISQDFDDGGNLVGLSFQLQIGGEYVDFRLPVLHESVLSVMKEQGLAGKYLTEYHARRVAWATVRDWLRAQLSMIEAAQARLEIIMLPFAVKSDGRTVAEHVFENPDKLLE